MLQYNANVTNNRDMKTLITKFWKHLLYIIFFFIGVWVFNHISAWFGIIVGAVSLVYLVEFINKTVQKELKD